MPIYDLIASLSWVAFIMYWFVSAFFVKRDASRHGFLLRSVWIRIFVAVIIAVIVSHAHGRVLGYRFNSVHFPSHPVVASIGALLSVLGIALAIYARVHLGRNWSPAPAIKEDHELVTSGPYALVRHPIYTGVLLAAFGTALVSPWWIIAFIAIAAIFIRRVFVEDKLMAEQFPTSFAAYKARTWALIPYIW